LKILLLAVLPSTFPDFSIPIGYFPRKYFIMKNI
jgi:hypothetical protein